MSRNFIISLTLGTCIFAQSAFAGVPYTAGRLPIVKPENVGWLLPSIEEHLENGNVKAINDEVHLVPNTMGTFKLSSDPEEIRPQDGRLLSPITTRCATLKKQTVAYDDLNNALMKINNAIQLAENKITTLTESMEVEGADLDAIDQKITVQQKIIDTNVARIGALEARANVIDVDLARLGAQDGYSVGGLWNNSFVEEEKIIKTAYPHISVKPVNTRVVSIVTTGMGSAQSKPFSKLVINDKDYSEGLTGIKLLTYKKSSDELSKIGKESIDAEGNSKVEINLSQALNVKTEASDSSGLSDNGTLDLGMYLSPSCKFLDNTAKGEAIGFTILKAYSTAVTFKATAKYNLKHIHDYVEKSKSGSTNPFRAKMTKDILEKIKKDGRFTFYYGCSVPDKCPVEGELREKMFTFLVDLGMKLFTDSVVSSSPTSLPLPVNQLPDAVGAGVTAAYGPAAGAAAKAITSVFTGSESRTNFHQEIDVWVEDSWDKIFYSEQFMSQSVKFTRK